jgi:hypothetical protein
MRAVTRLSLPRTIHPISAANRCHPSARELLSDGEAAGCSAGEASQAGAAIICGLRSLTRSNIMDSSNQRSFRRGFQGMTSRALEALEPRRLMCAMSLDWETQAIVPLTSDAEVRLLASGFCLI